MALGAILIAMDHLRPLSLIAVVNPAAHAADFARANQRDIE